MSQARNPSRRTAERHRRLLELLRRQSAAVGGRLMRAADAPELYWLATRAASVRGKAVSFGGISFPLRDGWWRYVYDPQKGQPLVAINAGLL